MAFEIVVVGTSLGGLAALEMLLAGLPRDFPLPLAVVQHRRASTESMLANLLRRHCVLPVKEPHDKEEIEAGRVYLAPADYHLLVEAGAFALSTEGPVQYARPSVDVLFISAADSYAQGVIGVVLTGANEDGAQGAARIKAAGGFLIVQEPETAECAAMPRAALAATAADTILPLSQIAPFLVRLCRAAQKEKR